MNRAAAIEALKPLIKITNAAFRALMNDPDPNHTPSRANNWSTHTPELYQVWSKAADAECDFRTKHELLDWPTRRRGR